MKVLVITAFLLTLGFGVVLGLQALNSIMLSGYVGAASYYSIELLKTFK